MKGIKFILSYVLLFSLITSTVFASGSVNVSDNLTSDSLTVQNLESTEVFSPQSDVLIQVKKSDGSSSSSADIVLIDLTGSSEVVYRGETDARGDIYITNTELKRASKLNAQPDIVYEAFILSDEGTLTRTVFSLPNPNYKTKEVVLKENNAQKSSSINKIVLIEDEAIKEETEEATEEKVEGIAELSKTIEDNGSFETNELSAQNVSASSTGCFTLVESYIKCPIASNTIGADTKIAAINVGSGESVAFNLTSSAKVSLQAGSKRDTSAFSVAGSVTLSADSSTSVDYNFGGSCGYFGSSFSCNLTRNVYAKYSYLYEKFEIKRYGVVQWTETTVTPIKLEGSSSTYEYTYNSNNGRAVSTLLANANTYGVPFEVFHKAAPIGDGRTTKTYSSEKTFTGGIAVPTPAGTFSGNVTTAYKNSHSITWFISSVSATTYYHYDYKTNGQEYYVTY